MPTSKSFKTEWLALNPGVLEQLLQAQDDHIRIDDMKAVSRTMAPGLIDAFLSWGPGITGSEADIPLRDWRTFLRTLRREREVAAITLLSLGTDMSDAERVLAEAETVFDDQKAALTWFDEPLSAFHGQTPRQAVGEGRAQDALAYLGSIESGFVG